MTLDQTPAPAARTGEDVTGDMAEQIAEDVAVVGLGYVGLPVAVAFAGRARRVVGFDISTRRIAELRAGRDSTGEVEPEAMAAAPLVFTADPEAMASASFFIVTVPTPIDGARRPDFGPLLSACALVGPRLRPGSVVVFESTVHPGATEEICGPALERSSGLVAGRDFTLGYSPERINPGDQTHRFESIVKVVAGQDAATLERVARAYGAVVRAGIHRAPSIRVAEAAKVIENTQRDINIALMNELALIFDRLGVRTADVLAAAGTKWNFLPFSPGLVGGHCIGVDPYYLTAKAEAVGYYPQVILAGRRINDGMGRFVARKAVKLMVAAGVDLGRARVGLLGLTFKEDVPDLRNSRSPDIVAELAAYGIAPMVHDAEAGADAVEAEFGLKMTPLDAFADLDLLILAVAHKAYLNHTRSLLAALRPGGVVIDLKSRLDPAGLREDLRYWSL